MAGRSSPVFGSQSVALAGGAPRWNVAAKLAGRKQPWNAPVYWTATCPLRITLAGVLGFLVPRRAWRWRLAVFLAQPVVVAVFSSLPALKVF